MEKGREKFELSLQQDCVLGELEEKLKEKRGKFFRATRPIQNKINKRKLVLALESGFVVKRVRDMVSERGDSEFVRREESRMQVYRNKQLEEYVHCDVCKLYVRGEPREQRYNELGPLCGSAGTRYYCNFCNNQIGDDVKVCS